LWGGVDVPGPIWATARVAIGSRAAIGGEEVQEFVGHLELSLEVCLRSTA